MDRLLDSKQQDLGTPNIPEGDDCYDFSRKIYDDSDGTEKEPGKIFHLSEVTKEKPVVLIFGSNTGPPFRVQLEPLHKCGSSAVTRLIFSWLIFAKRIRKAGGSFI